MAISATTFKDDLQQWVEKNPLRVWRKKQGLSASDAALALDLNYSSFQPWERGSYRPMEESMQKMADAMGIKLSTLDKKWSDWYAKRPAI
jgi:transcriptional regulator with XRE-family HTH domain